MGSDFHVWGDGATLFRYIDGSLPAPKEVMFEGIAGGGKTRIWAEWIRMMCLVFPGSKGLVLRKTRVDLNEAFLAIWEDEVWGPGSPVLKGPSKEHRRSYTFPAAVGVPIEATCEACHGELGEGYAPRRFYLAPGCGVERFRCQRCGSDMRWKDTGPANRFLHSSIHMGGMDKPTRLYSTQYCWAYWNEMQEAELEEWESLHRALRRPGAPFWLLGGDCNPDRPTHWANLRAGATEAHGGLEEVEQDRQVDELAAGGAPTMHRLVSRFSDNPTISQEYVDTLFRNLSGPRRERLAKGLWSAAEGMVWPGFRRKTHVLLGEIEHAGGMVGEQYVGPVNLYVKGWKGPVRLQWFLAGLDWGFSRPGCLGVWGFDGEGRMYEVAEVYQSGRDTEWWADRAVELYRKFPFEALICDHDPNQIKIINDRLGPECGHELEALAVPWEKRRQDTKGEKAGIDVVRVRMKKQPDGLPRIFWLYGNLYGGVDKACREKKRPLCTVQEIEGYVYPVDEGGKRVRDEPDPGCPDHGCDQTRAVAWWAHLKDLSPEPEVSKYHPRSYGALLGHEEVVG